MRAAQGNVPAYPFLLLQVNIRLWSPCGLPGVICMSPFPTKPWREPVQALLAPGSVGRC